MSNDMVDQSDKVAFRNELGHNIAWDSFDEGDATEEQKAEFDAAFEIVTNGSDSWFHTDGHLYQGSTLMRVIRRKADGELFGFTFWEGGGKYRETIIEHNGDEHGFPSKYDWEEGVDDEEAWFVFLPVEYTPIPAYHIASSRHQADTQPPVKRVEEIRARHRAAVKEPWRMLGGNEWIAPIGISVASDDGGVTAPEAEFIVNAPADITYLLSLIESRA